MALLSERFSDDGKAELELSDIQIKYIDIFRKKCESGEYRFRKCKCECGSSDLEVIAKKDRYGIPMDTVICRECGLITTNPRLDDDSNNKFYDNEYPFIYREEETPSEKVFLVRKKSAESIIKYIRKHTGIESGSVLEIGCADGRNVEAFAEFGYDACGIDLSHSYVEFGKNRGLNLTCCDAETFEKDGHKFDIIVLNHVIEHFTDIIRELEIIGRMLKPDGCLFISVPGVKAMALGTYDSDFLKLLQNAHIYNFTKDTLCSVMEGCGYSCIHANEFIYSLFKKSEVKERVQNAYEDTMKFLKRLEDAQGNLTVLLIGRVIDKISSYKDGEVLLYGVAGELDAVVRNMEDVSPIKGFFYSDSKSPKAVIDYIRSSNNTVKCMILIDVKQNDTLTDVFSNLIENNEIELFSAYNEQF